jgi:hypothetical protein
MKIAQNPRGTVGQCEGVEKLCGRLEYEAETRPHLPPDLSSEGPSRLGHDAAGFQQIN